MKRGDLVTVAIQGDLGKPCPALVIQSDLFDQAPTVTVLPITSTLTKAPLLRLDLLPNDENGLNKPSQVMIDKAITVSRDKLGPRIGAVGPAELLQIERSLALFLGIT